jgi:hypothetical protein
MSWILKWKSSLRLLEPGPAIDWKKVQVRENLRLHEHGLDSIAVRRRSEPDSYLGSSEAEFLGEAFHRIPVEREKCLTRGRSPGLVVSLTQVQAIPEMTSRRREIIWSNQNSLIVVGDFLLGAVLPKWKDNAGPK